MSSVIYFAFVLALNTVFSLYIPDFAQLVFWRQLASAPAAWIRDNMQKMCPFGHADATRLLAMKDAHDVPPKPSLWGLLSGGSKQQAPAPPAAHNASSSLPPPPMPPNSTLAQPGDIVAVRSSIIIQLYMSTYSTKRSSYIIIFYYMLHHQ